MSTGSRYGNQDLFLPKEFHADFRDRLVHASKERAPFNRQVDLWWYAVGLGVKRGFRTPLPEREALVKFSDGGILESDAWRISHLELLVLGEYGEEKASSPSAVIQTANEYAMTGCGILTEELRGVVDPQTHIAFML